ncbi:MAG: response regulator [Alphaproteobacteria bacterium]|nr:response regulator [Alphaproteobacteria bacterium]
MSKKEDHNIEDVKANFLATMSHEMRTPMQSVYGLLELIELEETSDSVNEMVKVAKESASALLEILDDVLEFSKMDAGKMELDDFEVPLRTLVRGVIEALSVQIKGRDIMLVDRFAKDVPFVVKGDPKRLRQILINLVGNALKFTEKGEILISVKVVTKLPLVLRFEVRDTGIGLTDAACARLFKPFNQADNTTSRKFGGTGLGLSICKKITDLMDGEIGVTSVEGDGSTFWFEIPTSVIDGQVLHFDLPDLVGLSVLSVEDHPQGAKEIVNSLVSMGAYVESCATVKEALDLVNRRPFDVGVIDQGLPDGTGLDLIRQISEMKPFMGCLMYTARDDAGLRNSLQSLGFDYVSKPASRKGLGEAVLDASNKVARFDIEHAPKRLLIAEDTASIRDLLRRQLSLLNIEADIVDDGVEALEALKNKEYGVLITDLHMPALDGYGVISAIRGAEKKTKSKARLPVIVLTADVQVADRQVYLKYGFDECLLKPVTLGHFKRLLIRWGMLQERQEEGMETAPVDEEEDTPINLNALERQLGSIDAMAIEMLSMFVKMTQPLVEQLQSASEAGDSTQIREVAHSLKGSARSAGAVRMGDIAFEIQENAEGDTSDERLFADIIQEFENVKSHIKSLEEQYKN